MAAFDKQRAIHQQTQANVFPVGNNLGKPGTNWYQPSTFGCTSKKIQNYICNTSSSKTNPQIIPRQTNVNYAAVPVRKMK